MSRGHLDQANRHCVRGWAIDEADAQAPVRVEIRIDGDSVARLVANQYREDLDLAFGTGRCGFELFLPGLNAAQRHLVSARIEGATHDLAGSPVLIEAATVFDADVEASLVRMIQAGDMATLDRAAVCLSAQIELILDRRAAVQSGRDARDLKYRWFAHRAAGGVEGPPHIPKRALLIAATQPDAARGIDGFRMASHASCLRRLGYQVGLVAVDLVPDAGPEGDRMRLEGIDIFCRPFSASVEEVLRRQRGCFDVVVLFGAHVARPYIPLVEHYCPTATIVYAAMAGEADAGQAAGQGFFAAIERARAAEADAIAAAAVTILGAADDPHRVHHEGGRIRHINWAVALQPTTTTLQRRRGIAILDDPRAMPAGVLDLLLAAREIVRAEAPGTPFLWRHPLAADQATLFDDLLTPASAIADIADGARVALTLSSTPSAYRNVVESLAAGLPCVAPTQVLRDLGLPRDLFVCDTSKAAELARALLRLCYTPASHDAFRKRALDDLDLHHSEDAMDATWAAALRAGRARPGTRCAASGSQVDHRALERSA